MVPVSLSAQPDQTANGSRLAIDLADASMTSLADDRMALDEPPETVRQTPPYIAPASPSDSEDDGDDGDESSGAQGGRRVKKHASRLQRRSDVIRRAKVRGQGPPAPLQEMRAWAAAEDPESVLAQVAEDDEDDEGAGGGAEEGDEENVPPAAVTGPSRGNKRKAAASSGEGGTGGAVRRGRL